MGSLGGGDRVSTKRGKALMDDQNPLSGLIRLSVRVGAFVEVRVPDRKYEGVLRLPSSALYNSSKIYVIEKGRLAERKVEVVGRFEGDVLVRGEVKPGERIVRTRLTRPGDGLRVKEL